MTEGSAEVIFDYFSDKSERRGGVMHTYSDRTQEPH